MSAPMSSAADARTAFAAWLKAARTAAGLSQREVAEAVYWHQSKIAKIEGGELIPRLDEAAALANVFDTTLDFALGLKKGSPVGVLAQQARQAASYRTLLQQIRASIDAELGGAS